MTHSTVRKPIVPDVAAVILKRPLPAMIVLGATRARRLFGDQCRQFVAVPARPGRNLRQRRHRRSGGSAGRVSAPDAAPADRMTIREPLYRVRGGGQPEPAAQPCEGGCRFRSLRLARARLFGADPGSDAGARGDGEAGSWPDDAGPMKIAPETGTAPSQTAGADPAIESATGTPALRVGPEPSAALRTEEVVARIWIAPFVDANGVYREAANVRVVLEPAGWRVP